MSFLPMEQSPMDVITYKGTDAYSSEKSYSIGDYVIHEDTLYKCVTNCSADTWENNEQYFSADTIVNALSQTNSTLKEKSNLIAVSTYSSSISVPASGSAAFPSITMTKAGYTAIYGKMSGQSYGDYAPFNENWSYGNGTASCTGYVGNFRGSASTVTYTATVIWVKNI